MKTINLTPGRKATAKALLIIMVAFLNSLLAVCQDSAKEDITVIACEALPTIEVASPEAAASDIPGVLTSVVVLRDCDQYRVPLENLSAPCKNITGPGYETKLDDRVSLYGGIEYNNPQQPEIPVISAGIRVRIF